MLMAVTVKIPTQLRAATGGEGEVEVRARPSARCSTRSSTPHADLRERITQDGDLRRFVNVYVSGEDIRFQEGLDTEIDDGDEVTILPAVAGGWLKPPGRHPLRGPRHAAARADRGGPQGAGRDRRPSRSSGT